MVIAHRTRLWLLAALVLLPLSAADANTRAGTPVWFPQTRHTLAFAFREFFDARGGLPMFGYPLTEVFIEDGRPVQYFERARMEWHGKLGIVQLGHLGRWLAAQQPGPAMAPVPAPDNTSGGHMYFKETGHTLRGEFRTYWLAHGGLPVFGLPLSEEFVERNPDDGGEYVVQYFERARFELHPELPSAYRVSQGHLGRRYVQAFPAPAIAVDPVADTGAAWALVRPSRITIQRIDVDTEVTAAGFSLGAWDVPRYTAAHYWPVGAYPGTAGNIAIAGHIGYRDTIFNHLTNVRIGDEISVYVGATAHRYVVREVLTVLPRDTWVMMPTDQETLTLITCVPIGVYTHRLVVRAEPAR